MSGKTPRTQPQAPNIQWRGRRSAVIGCWVLGVGGSIFFAASARAADPALAAARRALDESLPQIAIQKLHAALAASGLSPDERDQATQLLAEAQLADGRPDHALGTVLPLAQRGLAAAQLLRAHALLATRKWGDALPIYETLAAAPEAPLAAGLGAVECLQALGRPSEALNALEETVRLAPGNAALALRLASLLAEAGKGKRARALLATVQPGSSTLEKWKLYLDGRLLLLEGHADPARAAFEKLLREPEGLTPGLLAGAALGAADARTELHGSDAADKPLETFLWNVPESPFLELVFTKLDQVYAQQKNPTEGELQKMALKDPPRRAALARYYVARMQVREKKFEKAASSLEVLVQLYPEHPLVPYAHLMQADLRLTRGDLPGAVRALEAAERRAQNDEQRAEIQLRTGLVLYQQQQYLLALNEFRKAGARSPKLRENATFNAALAALAQKNFDRFLTEYRELTERLPGSPLRSELIAEHGLAQARHADPRAEDTLQLFLNHFPLSPRQGEARLALAELAYSHGDTAGAARYLQAANESPARPETTEHAAYLAVFLAEAQTPGDDRKTIEAALDFIRKYPKSPLLPEVRMKLAQLHFRSHDFPAAETQFATLAQENPTSPFAETALFLAGKSAMEWIDAGTVARALEFFAAVVQRDGPLKLYARQQQAIVQSKLSREGEAVTIYDAILTAQPPPEPELRYAVLAGKGDNLFFLGRKEPAQLDAAIAVFDQLATLPEAPATWRNQALYKKAQALEQLNRVPEALAAYYAVLEAGGPETREFFWFYKAGFDAARIFQEKQDWKEAIAIYEKMARLEGPRAAESKEQARQLRLKHFIWE